MDKRLPKSPARVWALLEDRLFSACRVAPYERVLLYHLLRHTLLRRRRRMRIAKTELARATGMCPTTVRLSLRALERKQLLRVLDRGQHGLLIEVHAQALSADSADDADGKNKNVAVPQSHRKECIVSLNSKESVKWFDSAHHGSADSGPSLLRPTKAPALRRAIFDRERGRCFYCRRKLAMEKGQSCKVAEWHRNKVEGASPPRPSTTSLFRHCATSPLPLFTLDHILPASQGGADTLDNLVACCAQCNSRKGEMPAAQFLRYLLLHSYLSYGEYKSRVRALRSRGESEVTGVGG